MWQPQLKNTKLRGLTREKTKEIGCSPNTGLSRPISTSFSFFFLWNESSEEWTLASCLQFICLHIFTVEKRQTHNNQKNSWQHRSIRKKTPREWVWTTGSTEKSKPYCNILQCFYLWVTSCKQLILANTLFTENLGKQKKKYHKRFLSWISSVFPLCIFVSLNPNQCWAMENGIVLPVPEVL